MTVVVADALATVFLSYDALCLQVGIAGGWICAGARGKVGLQGRPMTMQDYPLDFRVRNALEAELVDHVD